MEKKFGYIVDDIINVVYTNDNILLVKNDGILKTYADAISKGYKYIITIM